MSVTLKVENNIGIIEFNQPDSKVNILTAATIQRFDKLLEELRTTKVPLDALLIISGKKDVFIAGADIKEIEGITASKEGEAKSRLGQSIFDKLEDLRMPSIVVIDGVALGGGCELALACDYRLATFNDKVKIGLPEINLGIFPGFGGTYRMPRLVGLQQGLKLILTGKPVSATNALRIGLVDRLIPQNGWFAQASQFIQEVKGAKRRRRKFNKQPKGFNVFLEKTIPGRMLVISETRKNILKTTKGHYPAPLHCLRVIQRSMSMNRERGMALEAREFSKLAITDISKNLIKVFYLSEKYRKLLPPECESVSTAPVKKCGVLGAGIMGGGIAQILSYKDITTRMKDIDFYQVAQGLRAARKVFDGAVKRRKLSRAEATTKMGMITGTTDYSGFRNVDAVIEAVVENMDVKKKVFQEVGDVIHDEALLCTNTSALSVTAMAQAVKNPQRVIGFHFFNPVHRMPLVELITTEQTTPETLARALALAKLLNKTPVIVKDAPGFLVNRILLGYINEAGRILEEGVPVNVIDALMTDFGMPMGPLMLSDEVGLDVGVKVLHILQEGLGERFKPVTVFDLVVQKGLLGKKSGKGFYLHQKGRAPNPMIRRLCTSHPQQTVPANLQEFRDRMVYIMINEAARCLEDGIVNDPADVDVGMIMGTGFPPFRGGLLRYADHIGINDIYDVLKLFEGKLNAVRFQPCKYICELKDKRIGFYH